MGKSERKACLAAIRGRYRKANQAQKTQILDEFCAVCGYHRNYALRRLDQPPEAWFIASAGQSVAVCR